MKNLPVVSSDSQLEIFDKVNSIKMETNKRTGEKKLRVAQKDGTTQFGTSAPCGVEEYKKTYLLPYSSKEERNKQIAYLYNKDYRQEDIAAMLNISQSTVSKVLRSKR